MAHSVESRSNNPANLLRDAMDRAERLVVMIDRDSAEEFLVLLDQIQEMLDVLSQSELDLRPEYVRWQSLQNRIFSRPLPIRRAVAAAGGYAKLRSQHPPADGVWWHLDTLINERRRKSLSRTIATFLIVVGVLAGLYWGVNFFFPPDPAAVLMVETNSIIDRFILEEKWSEALALVETTLETLPDDYELWVWKTVLHERLAEEEKASKAMATAQQLLENGPIEFWVALGNTRLQVGDVPGAKEAGANAVTLNPDDPSAYMLLGSVAEITGDIRTAVDMYNKTYELAEFSNPELAVIARVRMGQALQSPRMPPEPTPESPISTPAP